MRKLAIIYLILFSVILLTSCTNDNSYLHIQKVGMLVEGNIQDNHWDQKGYEGLIAIGEEFDVNVYVKEEIKTKYEMIHAIDQFIKNGVNLIIGHSNSYGRVFVDISHEYPDVHFVYLNGGYFSESVTSLNFSSHATGFFNGMIASKMTKTKQIGIIAAYEWQTEIEGFFEGAKYQNPATNVNISFVNDWNKEDVALEIYDRMRDQNVDVFFPLGDSFSSSIIEEASKDEVYVLGYLSGESDKENVLASTVQHIDKLYLFAAQKFNEQSLDGGLLTFNFQDGAIDLGDFNSDIPKEYQKLINQLITNYIETNLLPNEIK